MLYMLSNLIDSFNLDQNENIHNLNLLNSEVLFYVKDRNGKFLECNEKLAHAVHHNQSTDLIGHTDFDLIWSQEAPLYKENDQKIMSENEAELFIENSTMFDGKEDRKCYLLSYKKPVHSNSKKIIGIKGLSVVLDTNDLAAKSFLKYLLPHDSRLDEKLIFYSYIEKFFNLTERQKECLYYLTKGMTSKQIARRLNLSSRTVEHHIENIKIQLNCFSRAQLIERLSINY